MRHAEDVFKRTQQMALQQHTRAEQQDFELRSFDHEVRRYAEQCRNQLNGVSNATDKMRSDMTQLESSLQAASMHEQISTRQVAQLQDTWREESRIGKIALHEEQALRNECQEMILA